MLFLKIDPPAMGRGSNSSRLPEVYFPCSEIRILGIAS